MAEHVPLPLQLQEAISEYIERHCIPTKSQQDNPGTPTAVEPIGISVDPSVADPFKGIRENEGKLIRLGRLDIDNEAFGAQVWTGKGWKYHKDALSDWFRGRILAANELAKAWGLDPDGNPISLPGGPFRRVEDAIVRRVGPDAEGWYRYEKWSSDDRRWTSVRMTLNEWNASKPVLLPELIHSGIPSEQLVREMNS